MRDFSWKYFAMTGDVDAYLLYKDSQGTAELVSNTSAEEEAAEYEENE
ncbi:YqzL family protein [Paenibacillus dakarensis]|nr:YqzL family protein [Paenibacillus dakarensis]